MSQKTTEQKPRLLCPFCEGTGKKGKEHFWSGWAADILDEPGGMHRVTEYEDRLDGRTVYRDDIRQGGINKKQVRRPCIGCNTGWMSLLETRAMGTVRTLATGQTATLDAGQRTVLAQWITMKAIIAESANQQHAVTSQAERRAMMDALAIPRAFQIHIGTCGTQKWRVNLEHFACNLNPASALEKGRKNMQSICWGFGDLYVFVLCGKIVGRRFEYKGPETIVRLWPLTEADISWPRERIGDDFADGIAEALRHWVSVNFGIA